MGNKSDRLNILVLDDNEHRLTFFQTSLAQHCVLVCRHVQPAQHLLKKEPFDILFLDHDLEGFPAEPDSPNCGTALPRFLKENQLSATILVIHTENRTGREAMKAIWPDALVIPYHKMKAKGLRSIVKNLTAHLPSVVQPPSAKL